MEIIVLHEMNCLPTSMVRLSGLNDSNTLSASDPPQVESILCHHSVMRKVYFDIDSSVEIKLGDVTVG